MNFIPFTIKLTETTKQINTHQTIYPLTIEFNNNEITVCQKEITKKTVIFDNFPFCKSPYEF